MNPPPSPAPSAQQPAFTYTQHHTECLQQVRTCPTISWLNAACVKGQGHGSSHVKTAYVKHDVEQRFKNWINDGVLESCYIYIREWWGRVQECHSLRSEAAL